MATKKSQCLAVEVRGTLSHNSFQTPLSVNHINLFEGKWQICVKSIVVEFKAQANEAVRISSPLVKQYYFSESKGEDVLKQVNLKVFKLYSKVSNNLYLMSPTTHTEVINFPCNWFNITHPAANLSCNLTTAFGSPLQSLPDHPISIEFYLRRVK
jgi:hypothetical protein